MMSVTHSPMHGIGIDFTLDSTLPTAYDFSPSDETMALTVTVLDDNILEIDESFALTLFKNTSVPDVSVAPGRGIATIVIEDNESEDLQLASLASCHYSNSLLFVSADIVLGFNETEIRVEEDVGTFNVYLEVFSPDPMLISDGFASANLVYLSSVFATEDSALGEPF